MTENLQLGRRSVFPAGLAQELRSQREAPMGALKRIVAPEKIDDAFARLTGLKSTVSRQVRYGARSLSLEEWETFISGLRSQFSGQPLFAEALTKIADARDAFLRPFSDEALPSATSLQKRRGRKPKSQLVLSGKDSQTQPPLATVPEVSDRLRSDTSMGVVTIDGFTIGFPRDKDCTLEIIAGVLSVHIPLDQRKAARDRS